MPPVTAPQLPRLESAGLDGWIVRLFEAIEETNLPWLAALSRRCETALGDALVDLVPSYTTLLVVFDPLQLSSWEVRHRLVQLLADLEPEEETGSDQVQELPTWYDASVGPELARVARHTGLTESELIECHSQTTYRVFALGFAPGFAFMGLTPPRLECPRLDTPRRRVPVGSVAIAGRQTAAYPSATPGGWNILGRTCAKLFDREREGFSLLRVGDLVRFVPVSREDFEARGGDLTAVEQET